VEKSINMTFQNVDSYIGYVCFDYHLLVRCGRRGPTIPGLCSLFLHPCSSLIFDAQVLFIGVMSCLYVLWDVIGRPWAVVSALDRSLFATDDTIARKVNASDASAFAHICGCCPSQGPFSRFHGTATLTKKAVWGVIWLIIAFVFFAAGIIVGLVAFKVRVFVIQRFPG